MRPRRNWRRLWSTSKHRTNSHVWAVKFPVDYSKFFKAAKKRVPVIISIYEINTMGGRKLKDQLSLKMTLNILLVQLDGFEENN